MKGFGGGIAVDNRGFAEMLSYVRAGKTINVPRVNSLGSDAIDVRTTIRITPERDDSK